MTRTRTAALLVALYLAQGLPFGFFTQALPVLMRDAGWSLTEIGALGLLFAPWTLKLLWAPAVDRYGTRRRWLVALQLASAGLALALAVPDLDAAPAWLFVGIALVNVVSATQDIATDGLAVTILAPHERGIGNAIQVGAYRVGMVLGGGALLWWFSLAGWRWTFVALGLLLLLTTLPVLTMREPVRRPDPTPDRPTSLLWWDRLRSPGVLTFAVLLVVFKLGDTMGSAVVGPYLRDAGLTLAQIAVVKGTLASAVVLVGAAIGGWIDWRVGRRAAIVVGGSLQVLVMALFALTAVDVGGLSLLVTACLLESVVGGIATVALFTLMMDASDPEHAGTDYTILACAVVSAQGVAALAGGVVGDLFGYLALFAGAGVLAAVGCVVLVVALDRGLGPARIRPVWTTRTLPSPQPSRT